MKQIIPIIILAIIFTGCLDTPNSSDCNPVDERSFLEEYAQQPGVTKLDSGLLYKVIEEGDGDIPTPNKMVFVDFSMKLITGERFARSENLTFFALDNNLLPGIQEGLSLMPEGSTYELVLPTELAYGNNPPAGSPVRCGAVIIIEMKLDSFLRDVETFLNENEKREDVNVTESGLQYRVIEEGEGDKPEASSTVRVKYKGTFTNGYVFDQTTGNNVAEFGVGGVISGFSEGLQLMTEGSKYELFIPPNLAYGSNPPSSSIPPNAILIFEVELVEIL